MRKSMPIFYSALLLTGVNLLLRLVGTSFQVFLSGRIGPEGIGLLQLVMSVGMLAMTAGMAGIRTTTMYLTAEEFGRRQPANIRWILSGCGLYSILCSALVSLILYLSAPLLSRVWIGNPDTEDALRLFALLLPLHCLCGVMTGYFTAAKRIAALAAVEVAEQLFSMVTTMLLLTFWAGTESSRACMSVILGSGGGAGLTLLVLIILHRMEKKPKGRRISVGKRILQTAVPLALADDLKTGISTTENLMVPKRLALFPFADNPLAAFGIVTGMVFPVLMFPAAILYGLAELLIPELARCSAAGSTRRIRYLVFRSLRVALIYGCLFCGLMLILAEPLCIRLYSNQEAGRWLRRFAFLIPVLYCDAITDAMTKGLGQQKICVRYNILTSSMDVALLFFLLPRYGMQGYYISFMITHVLNFLLSLRLLLRITGLQLHWHVPLRCLAATALTAGVCLHLHAAITKSIAYVLILGCLLFLFQVLQKEDLLWLRGLVTKK